MKFMLKAVLAGFVFSVSQAAAAQDSGLLILYNSDNTSANGGLSRLAAMDCNVWRTGKIDPRGPMNIGDVNKFALVDCETSLLEQEEKRVMLQSAFRKDSSGIVLEGNFIRKADTFAEDSVAKKRGYLIKISRFNNEIATRFSEEDKIDSDAALRPENWKGEARLRIHSAIGMPTPDEVGVIYYDTPEMMVAFRQASPDLVQRIGDFNKRHLQEQKYLYLEIE